MVQVHTLNDFNSPSSSPFPRPSGTYAQHPNGAIANPGGRKSLIDIVLPNHTWSAVIVYISIAQFVAYVTFAILRATNVTIQVGWLTAGHRIGISDLLNSYGPPIREYFQVWRFLTPIMLHAGVMHLLFNIFFQLRMGFTLEKQYGKKMFLVIYLLCALGGNILSLSLAPCKVAVGASTAGFGLIGLQFVEMALAWHLMENGQREQIVFSSLFFIILCILLSTGNSVVDWRGHLGGIIAGFALGFVCSPTVRMGQSVYARAETGNQSGRGQRIVGGQLAGMNMISEPSVIDRTTSAIRDALTVPANPRGMLDHRPSWYPTSFKISWAVLLGFFPILLIWFAVRPMYCTF